MKKIEKKMHLIVANVITDIRVVTQRIKPDARFIRHRLRRPKHKRRFMSAHVILHSIWCVSLMYVLSSFSSLFLSFFFFIFDHSEWVICRQMCVWHYKVGTFDEEFKYNCVSHFYSLFKMLWSNAQFFMNFIFKYNFKKL